METTTVIGYILGLHWGYIGIIEKEMETTTVIGYILAAAIHGCQLLVLMLRILAISGEELASVAVEEASNVRALKLHLHKLHSFPPRFQQRILHCGTCLDDASDLLSNMDLQLVLLRCSSPSDLQAEELRVAAAEGLTEELERLLLLPLEPDLADDLPQPMLLACRNGHVEVAQLLLEAGGNPNPAPNPAHCDGDSALYAASAHGHVEVAQMLLEAGANPNQANFDGDSALYAASAYGHAEVVHLLLEARADVSLVDTSDGECGHTAVRVAAATGHAEVLHLLLKAGADVESDDVLRQTLLHVACMHGHVEAARLLLQAGADKDAVDKYGCTALQMASAHNRIEVARLLLKVGADRNLADDAGQTALHVAASYWHREIVSLLVEAGADVNITDQNGSAARSLRCYRSLFDA